MVLLTLVSVTVLQSVGTIGVLITPAQLLICMLIVEKHDFLFLNLQTTASVLGLFIGYSFFFLMLRPGSSIVLTAASSFLDSFFIAPQTTIFED